MRHHKPDIVVILAVLVSIGVILTTAVQAAEVPDQGIVAVSSQALAAGPDKIHCDVCPAPMRHKDVILGPKGAPIHGSGHIGSGQSMLESVYAHTPAGFVHPRGVRYDFMFNTFHAVMYTGGGSVDVTLKVDNLHTPAEDLNPYLSLSLGSRW